MFEGMIVGYTTKVPHWLEMGRNMGIYVWKNISISIRPFGYSLKANPCGVRPKVDNIIPLWRYVVFIVLTHHQ